ncbi:MAG: Tfx family DNA-binding protein [Acidilobaceae archaeon]
MLYESHLRERELEFTKRQAEVLKLRSMGLTQREVAKALGTTRENVAMLEKRALENAEKALKVFRNYLKALSSFSEIFARGENIEEASKKVFRKGNEVGIKIKPTQPQLAEVLRILGDGKTVLTRPLEVFVLKDGSVVVLPADARSLRSTSLSRRSGGPAGT